MTKSIPPTMLPAARSALVRRPKAALEYSDHGSLHGTVLRAVGGAAGGVLIADLLSRVFSFGLADSAVLPIAVAAGALGAIAVRGKKWVKGLLGASLGLGGGALFVATAPYWTPFAALLFGAATVPVLAEGESWKRKTITGLLAGAFAAAGVYVGQVILTWDMLAGVMPGPIASAAAGAAAGLFFGLAGAPKYLARPADPVELAYLEALLIKDGELHEILGRTLGIHQAVRTDLEARPDDDTVKTLGARVGDMTMRILHIAGQCRRIESDLSAAPGYELEERIDGLEKKALAAKDPAAKETYRAAIETLDEQRQGLDAIYRGRERVVAKLHANVALLEKVRFSLVHLRSADAEKFGGADTRVTEAIEELGRDIDATSSAIGEVYGRADHDLLPSGSESVAALAPVGNVVSLDDRHPPEPAADDDPDTHPDIAPRVADHRDG